MEINQPNIGDHVLSGHDKVLNAKKLPKFDLLTLNGSTFDPLVHVKLYNFLGTNVLPVRDSGDFRVPYKIVGDLT